ncbi:hypothetical protein [Streptomyces sp. ISL-11]|uniref:hypothetical protein n=1 Tax=Streptomyces sp. ISL-11 TaxID=2819174 RepID=UPI001BE73986|nr:hypothetical protein [Streptomyces sp. ISL-11]MBT2386678.1 hypothetical protein [Streptomyces sp. ISL-11]
MNTSEALDLIDRAQKLSHKDESSWSVVVPGSLYSVAAFSLGGSLLLSGSKWMVPLIVVASVATAGVVATAILFAKRGGILALPGGGLTMNQRWGLMWLSFAVMGVEVAAGFTFGLGWAVMLAGILGWVYPGVREWLRKK